MTLNSTVHVLRFRFRPSDLLLGCLIYSSTLCSAKPQGISSFEVRPGFRVELVAAEPLVESPVALAFDERGRLFVAEIPGYPDRRPGNVNKGRVRLLQSPGSNGVYTSSSIYAGDLTWPSALACYDGGVFVAAASEILYLKDRQTNGQADVDELIFSGFGRGTSTPSAEDTVNSFQWGLDNRIHGVTAGIGGVISSLYGGGAGAVSLEDSDFSFDPRTRRIFPEATPAQSGLAFDESGRRFTCDLDRPLQLTAYQRRYFSRNPFFPRPPEIINVANPATLIYQFQGASRLPGEPLRAPAPPLPFERGGRPLSTAWLTSARSCLIYQGTTFPAEYRSSVFIADPAAHLIHREVLFDDGLEARARRASSEARTEFLLSRDPAFHPMQVVEGPEGALYVADRRENGGGRIYRIVPANFRAAKPPQLSQATTYQLVAMLASSTPWEQATASRLLNERQDRAASPLLADMLKRARSPSARLRALRGLAGLGTLKEEYLLRALRDDDARVREHAVLLSDNQVSDGAVSDSLWEQLKSMTADPALRVRYQLAFSFGEIQRRETPLLLADLLRRDVENPWISAAVQSSLAANAADVFLNLASDPRFRGYPAGFEVLQKLATQIGVMNQNGAVARVIGFLDGSGFQTEPLYKLVCALGAGLHQAGTSLTAMDPQYRLLRFYNQASLEVVAGTLGDARETLNIELLSMAPAMNWSGIDWPFTWLGTGQSQAIQAASIAALRYSPDPNLTTSLLPRWPALSPALRRDAVTTLLSRSALVGFTLGALEKGNIRPNDVSAQDMNFLRSYSDAAIRERALNIFGPLPLRRPGIVAQFQPALGLGGSADHGQQIFSARCASCHQLDGDIPVLGPNLAGVKAKGRSYILEAVLEPNAEVRPGYATSVLLTKAGENLIGIVPQENLLTVTLAQAGGARAVWPRNNLQSIEPQSWSLMPEGLEAGLSTQDMADLLEFLMTAGQR